MLLNAAKVGGAIVVTTGSDHWTPTPADKWGRRIVGSTVGTEL